jgi:hypothetical protein
MEMSQDTSYLEDFHFHPVEIAKRAAMTVPAMIAKVFSSAAHSWTRMHYYGPARISSDFKLSSRKKLPCKMHGI